MPLSVKAHSVSGMCVDSIMELRSLHLQLKWMIHEQEVKLRPPLPLLHCEQMPFPRQSGGKSAELPVSGDHTVAGNEKGQRVFAAGVGGGPVCAGAADGAGEFAVGFGFPCRDRGNRLPDLPLESGALQRAERRPGQGFSGESGNHEPRYVVVATNPSFRVTSMHPNVVWIIIVFDPGWIHRLGMTRVWPTRRSLGLFMRSLLAS